MPLTPSQSVFITCALTGSADTAARNPHVPVSPQQIAAAAIEAARAGAAVVHIHVRDPKSGAHSRDTALFREVVGTIRASGVDVVLNLTVGFGGDFTIGSIAQPLPYDAAGTDLCGVRERLAHVEELRPEICTLDCGSMSFGEGNYTMINTPDQLRAMAGQLRTLRVKPELEVFDTGHLRLACRLKDEGLLDEPMLLQFCMGIPYGAPDDIQTLLAMINNLPPGAVFSTFGIGSHQLPYVALAALTGGNVRVGLEDNLYLERGVKATNAALVGKAVDILRGMNVGVLTPAEVRQRLGLTAFARKS